MLLHVAKKIERTVFDRWIRPRRFLERDYSGDYGHGYFYEEVFCSDRQDLLSVLEISKGARGPVLDLAGGAGRVTKALAQSGHRVTLVDYSQSMLDQAEANLASLSNDERKRVHLVRGDLRTLHLRQKFSHIFSINHGFEHIGGRNAVEKALKRAKSHLSSGGKFVVDVHNKDYWDRTPHWKADRWFYCDYLRQTKHWLWSRTKASGENGLVWKHALSRNLMSYTILKTELSIFPLSWWQDCFQRVGLEIVSVWGDWYRHSVDVTRPKLIFTLKARRSAASK